jgi:cbb3-type cytochrome oxidase subunit 1
MRGISFWFFQTAAVYVTLGMIWGIVMSASGDHTLAPAHAHLNLIGWVTMALFGIYYHLVPAAGERVLAKIHFAVATAGVLLIVPGIVMALTDAGDLLAKIGSVLTLASMLLFVAVVFRSRAASARLARPRSAEDAA